MQDRNQYHLHNQVRATRRQHYAQANAPQAPRVPHWVKGLVILACIGLAGALTGCGGGGESSAPALETAAAPVCNHVVKIQLFGDSTMWGYLAGGNGARAAVYPELALQQEMDQRFGYGAVVVSTRAVSGTTSGHLLAGTDGANKPWPQSVDADIAVVNHGINDVAWGVTHEVYRDHLEQFAASPVQMVFQTPLPTSTAKTDYAQIMRDVANYRGIPIADARAYVQSLPDWWQYATDGVHATSEGYSAVTRNALAPVLFPLVAAARCKTGA